jgi:hypothetical protein
MYARVATFDGEPVGDEWAAAPPEASRSLTLVDPRHGKSLSVALFEDDPMMRQAPQPSVAGARPTAIEFYDVAVEQLRAERPARYARVGTHHGHPMRDVSPAPLVGLEGVVGLMMLIDRRSGKGLGFMLFESEDAMRRVDEIVSGMSPGTAGPTSSVELYEVVNA